MKPTKVLFVHNNNDLYGAEIALLEMLKRLDRSQFIPIVVLPLDTKHINRFSVELEKIGVDCRFMDLAVLRRRYFTPVGLLSRLWALISGVNSLVRLIRREQVDVVHSNTLPVVNGAVAAFITGRPHVWHIHELVVSPAWMRRIMHFLAPRFSKRIVANSTAVRDHLVADCPKYAGRIQVILNGVDLDPFTQATGGRKIREEWGVAQDEILVGMVGKVTRWKGQLVLAAAAKQVLDAQPNVKFASVGGVFDTEQHFMDRFVAEVEQLGISPRFTINDFRRDVPDVLQAFDIFVLPSTWPEPFGMVVIEAMAAGKPVIATAAGGPLEIVVPGQTGELVPMGDPKALAQAILSLIASPGRIRDMGQAGKRRAEEKFDVARYVREFEALYLELGRDAATPAASQIRSQAAK